MNIKTGLRSIAKAALFAGALVLGFNAGLAEAGQKLSLASVSHGQHPYLGAVSTISPTMHPKWQRVRSDILERQELPVAGLESILTLEPAAGQAAALRPATLQETDWSASSLDAVAAEAVYGPPSRRDLAERIRRRVALLEYREDEGDYWQTPGETMALGRGDCEDQAIMALHLALAAGIPADEVGLAVGYDRLGRAHAVMVLSDGGALLSIDINEPRVASVEDSGFQTKFVAYLDRLLIVR